MEKIDLVRLKERAPGYYFDIISNEPWNPIVKVLNTKLFVDVNDQYVIAYNDNCEIHLSCIESIIVRNHCITIRSKVLSEKVYDAHYILKPHPSSLE